MVCEKKRARSRRTETGQLLDATSQIETEIITAIRVTRRKKKREDEDEDEDEVVIKEERTTHTTTVPPAARPSRTRRISPSAAGGSYRIR